MFLLTREEASPTKGFENLVVFIDAERCMGCRACELACAVEHTITKDLYKLTLVPEKPLPRIRIVAIDTVYVPMKCQHCKNAPCVAVCPTRALYYTPEGFVEVATTRCIGCLLCSTVCPFGHPRYDPSAKAIIKCDFCVDRVKSGRLPACVEACPTGALKFGRLEDILEELSIERAKQIVSSIAIQGRLVTKPLEKPTSLLAILKSMYTPVSWVERHVLTS